MYKIVPVKATGVNEAGKTHGLHDNNQSLISSFIQSEGAGLGALFFVSGTLLCVESLRASLF